MLLRCLQVPAQHIRDALSVISIRLHENALSTGLYRIGSNFTGKECPSSHVENQTNVLGDERLHLEKSASPNVTHTIVRDLRRCQCLSAFEEKNAHNNTARAIAATGTKQSAAFPAPSQVYKKKITCRIERSSPPPGIPPLLLASVGNDTVKHAAHYLS